jgi:hypothetical protein
MNGARGGDGDCVHGEGILAVLARPTAAAGPGHACSWLADGHLALFVSDVVDALDLSAIFAAYVKTSNRGRAG